MLPAVQTKEKSLRVLIVEDEVLIAFDLASQVEQAGDIAVGTAVDLASCQRLSIQEKPDVVLMDMRLKGGDSGLDAARWLRSELNVACIFVSGSLDELTLDDLAFLRPVDLVSKPIMPSRILVALKKARVQKV